MSQNPEPRFEIPNLQRPEVETVAVSYQEQGASYSALAEILRRHTDRLMAMEGVVTVGQGQDEIGRDCITVGVKTARYLDKIPKTIDGVSVCATVVGEVDAL
jgi:hypothetical protein